MGRQWSAFMDVRYGTVWMRRTGLMALLLFAGLTLGEPTTGESSVETVFTLEEVIVRPARPQVSPRTQGAIPDSGADFTELEEVIVRPSRHVGEPFNIAGRIWQGALDAVQLLGTRGQ